ncbi:hypothetical protein LZ31DRAFT_636021 [Colletotrichum somersetense]|nr:hypothetical protein LZ31DRAFT_636021 [Colletotrichum somersetense]
MLFSHFTAIIGFAASLASAVDIYFYRDSNSCSGARTSCPNIGSNTCCGGGPARSILFTAGSGTVRTAQVYGYRGASGSGCASLILPQNARLPHCMSRADSGTFTGARWGSATLRRRAPEAQQCPAGEQSKCRETVRPNTVTVADGTEYDVQGLDEAKYNELFYFDPETYLANQIVISSIDAALSETFASANDVPEEFKSLRIVA